MKFKKNEANNIGLTSLKGTRKKIAHIIIFLLLLAGGLVMFFPLLWAVSGSLKTKNEFWAFPPTIFSKTIVWSNYIEALQVNIPLYIFNSVFTAGVIVLYQLFGAAMMAYALARLKFRFKTIIFNIIIILYMLPAAATYVPSYILLANLNLIDTYTGIIISNAASVFAIFLLRQYFLQVDKNILESAQIDGAGDFRILWKIMMPLSKPAFIVLSLNGFIGNYNNYMWPSLITRSPSKYLVSQGLRMFFIQEGAYGIKFPQMMAANIIVMLPTLILFAFTQKWFESGIADTGVKG